MALITPKNIQDSSIANLAASKLTGTVSDSQIASNAVAFKRAYTGKTTTAITKSTSVVSLFTIPNVVVNSGEDVYLAYHISMRNTSNSVMHAAVIPHYSGSATGYVGDGSWGLGIYDPSSHQQWNMMTGFVNLSQYRTGGGGPFNSTGTFTFDIRAKTTNTTGGYGGETSGASTAYTPVMATILVSNA
jgi:hypothetical protein